MADKDPIADLQSTFKSLGAAVKKYSEDFAKLSMPAINIPKIPSPDFYSNIDLRNYQFADYQFEIIKDTIKNFESELDQEHEVAFKLACFGQTITLRVTEIGFHNPSLLFFWGYIDGCDHEVQLIQHISQLSFLLMAVPKEEPKKPPRRIGFHPDTSEPAHQE
jgi:hypothetical protein